MSMPALRFNFDSDWRETPLSTLLTFNNGINATKDSYGHGRKFINVLDILNNEYILYDDIIGSVSVSEKQEEVSKVEYGDMLFLRSSETREDVGKSSTYLDENEYALFGGFVIRGKKVGEYDPYFLKLLLDTSSARDQVSSKAGGSTRYNVSQTILNSVSLYMPSLEEQHKIATFFSLFDQKKVKQQEKVKQLEQFKKGVTKKIFSQEIRFKDENGQDFPEWDEKSLGEMGLFRKGGSLSKSDLSETGESCILYGELYTRYTSIIEEVHSKTEVSDNGTVYGNVNDVLIPSSGESAIDIAQASALLVDNVLLGGDLNVFKPNEGVSGPFLSYQINSIKRKELAKLAQGASVVHLYSESLKKLIVWLPDYKEQLKIASFLSLLDKKIVQENKKLLSLKEIKKGFLQKMFI